MDNIKALGGDVYEIDTKMAGYSGITAGYLILSDRPCLVETGTSTSAPVVRDAIASLGVGPDELATVVVTHIHLDHAGGVGDIARFFPSAQIVVHEKGARHLADPSRLMTSARMVWGDKLDVLFGELSPTEAERIVALGDTGAIDLGNGRTLSSHYSPGHAKHHVGLVDSATGDLYVGDAAGVYLPETGDLRPATPPPDFDLQTALNSIALFEALDPQRLLFSHYGPVDAVKETLERSAEELRVWVDLTRQAHAEGMDLDHAVAMVRDRTKERYAQPASGDERAEQLELLSGAQSNVAGILHWLNRVSPDAQRPSQ
ncbi:MBL fold metallo-hydrolase [Nonomuraea sp. NPDC049309]|uniref:MBL fold metallo-hydrolase n=1 Tax=Nonomuraea sp. NPDC049309 TaxID=3364350 RepID=UPI00371877BC